MKPNRPAPLAPTRPMSPNGIPPPPPVPVVKVQPEARRQLPRVSYDTESDCSDREDRELVEGAKSPFTRMMEEMQEYSEQLPTSPIEHPVSKKSKGLEE